MSLRRQCGLHHVTVLACGFTLFAYLIFRIGPTSILTSFERLSWRLAVLMFFPSLLMQTFDTLGWRFAFPDNRVPFLTLATARLAGQAVNATTPTATLGGDAVKAWLLRDEVGLGNSLASVLIAKTTMAVSQGLFLLLGVLVATYTIESAGALVRIMEGLLLLEAVAVVGFVVVQLRGLAAGGLRTLEFLRIPTSNRVADTAAQLDRALATFYRRQPLRIVLSVVFGLLGWTASAGEMWLICYFLGLPVSVPLALIIEAFGTGIRFAAFFVPAQIGFAEAGIVATFLGLGLGDAAGLSVSLVRRAREFAWASIGLLIVASKALPAPVVTSAPST